MKKEVENPKDIKLIDVFDTNARKEILNDYLDAEKIKNPENEFSIEISNKSREAVTD